MNSQFLVLSLIKKLETKVINSNNLLCFLIRALDFQIHKELPEWIFKRITKICQKMLAFEDDL